ncbi:MAG: retropepsin-like aspartic protease [Desulfobacterales bacterium]|jgi:clan AA aspartic protease (TIGR02281 family)
MRITVLFLIAFGLLVSFVDATGIYHIGKDEGGFYMDTDQDGSWYIEPEHVRDFSLGERGRYSVRADNKGTFIITSKGKKYYINKKEQEKWASELQSFNNKQRQKGKAELKVNLLDGNHVLVPVTLGYGRNKMEITMLLDTGASITVLHQEIADELKLKNIGTAKLMIAGGHLLDSKIVKLDYVDVGPIKKKWLKVSVIEHSGGQTPYQGLLGMNFLKGLNYRIDYDREMIVWQQ